MRRLSVGKIVWGAFVLPWQHRAEVARAIAYPLLAVIACTLTSGAARLSYQSAVQWGLYTVYLAATCWLAISCHRLVLLSKEAATNNVDGALWRRFGLFFGATVVVSLIYYASYLPIVSLLLMAVADGPLPQGAARAAALPGYWPWLEKAASLLPFWISARFSLMLPVLATDGKWDALAAWRASRGNGWRLALVVGGIPWLLKQLIQLLYRQDATDAEFALLIIATALITVFAVVALSLAYWELTSPEPPPTQSPG